MSIQVEKLQVFLYLLARDHLTTGAIEKLMEIVNALASDVEFTSEHLAAMADEWATELQRTDK